MRTIKESYAALFGRDRPVKLRGCDRPGCSNVGEYRAPKSREQLYDYFWFCLEHVRDYNAAWDYYAGMSVAEVEQSIRHDTVWQRDTWPLGSGWKKIEDDIRQNLRDEFFTGAASASFRTGQAADDDFVFPALAKQALAVLGLQPPATLAEVRVQYKKLVKEHHPDRHGGSAEAEETLKNINQAFTTLKEYFAAQQAE